MTDSTRIGRINTAATSACLGAVFFWATGPIFIKYLTGHTDSWTQNALRYSAACVFWLPFVAYIAVRGTFPQRTWRRAIVPAIANVGMQSLWGAGFYYLSPAFMTLLTNTSILWVTGFSLAVLPAGAAPDAEPTLLAGPGCCRSRACSASCTSSTISRRRARASGSRLPWRRPSCGVCTRSP